MVQRTAKSLHVVSRIPEIPPQQYIVLEFFSDAIFGFATTFVMLDCLLHGMVGAISLSSFAPRVLDNFFVLFFIWIDKVNSSVFKHCRASVSLLPIPVFLDSPMFIQTSIHDLVW